MLSERILTKVLRVLTSQYLTLDPVRNYQLPAPKPDTPYMLYIHIPFCETLCPYCSFNRYFFDEKRARAYYVALREEMRKTHALGYQFSSLYIGGGTPTVLMDELVETIDLAKSLFPIKEVSCETNPNHLIPEVIEQLVGRVQRLSVGMQSFDAELLRQMNRLERFGTGQINIDRIRYANSKLPSLNVDMIFNFPSQTPEVLAADIQAVIDSGANQVTFYPLMSSPSVETSLKNSVGKVDYQREHELYQQILAGLQPTYQPLSAWTFARKTDSMLDEYIVDYDEYVGIGAGAFSFLDGKLLANTFSVTNYTAALAAGESAISGVHHFGLVERMRYFFLMKLFGLHLDKTQFKQSFGRAFDTSMWLELLFFGLSGAFAKNNAKELTLTNKGQYLMVVMMREFFANLNAVRDTQRKALSPAEQACTVIK